jgi:DNA processing protein
MQDPATDRWVAASGARVIHRGDAGFPAQLAALADPPPRLFALGNCDLLHAAQVAVVGSRHPTAAGRSLAARIAGDLARHGLVITSGLARGIDAAAHEAALAAGGRTIAVCGTGLDICYPTQHRTLFERIAREGLVLSEFAPGTPPRATHFPQRNRIISGLSRGVVVIEAAANSGSLITARHALSQGREVFAVPGSPLNPLAAGCLSLIRQGAALVRDAADVLPEIGISIEGNLQADQSVDHTNNPPDKTPRLDKEYEMLLDALGFEPSTVDDLVERTGLGPGSVASMLLILELEGRVETRPGALYNRIA